MCLNVQQKGMVIFMSIKKNWHRFMCLMLTFAIALSATAFAANEKVVNYNQTGVCNYGPDTGLLCATYYAEYAKTFLTCQYSSNDATAIANYNAENKYAGVDIKNVPSNYQTGVDMMDAYSISTTFPNPVTDLENDDILGNRNEEAEVVALGAIQGNTPYYVTVLWHDYRTGNTSDQGQWNVNAELSKKSIIDYNVISGMWSSVVQLTYGPNKAAA